jgi:glycosyltransferase involved in cell wall biosynthesis
MNDKPINRVLMVTNDYLPMTGGVANHIYNLAKALKRLGVDVRVLHICYSTSFQHFCDEVDFKVERVAVSKNLAGANSLTAKLARYFLSLTAARKALEKTAADFHPDVIHWHDYYHSSLTTKFMRDRVSSLVVTNHASQYLEQYELGTIFRTYLRYLVSHSHGIICTSEELSNKSEMLRKPCQFITNGVDETVFFPNPKAKKQVAEQFSISTDQKILLAPRRIDKKNGLGVLLKALPPLLKKHSDLVVIFAGSGDNALVNEYKQLAKSLEIMDRVRFLGAVSYKKMPMLIAAADIVVIPSYIEAVSLAALEALACGVPVIASNVGGLPYAVSRRNGDLFEPGAVNQLSELLIQHFDSMPNTIKKGKQARETVLERFTWSKVAVETLHFYNKINK